MVILTDIFKSVYAHRTNSYPYNKILKVWYGHVQQFVTFFGFQKLMDIYFCSGHILHLWEIIIISQKCFNLFLCDLKIRNLYLIWGPKHKGILYVTKLRRAPQFDMTRSIKMLVLTILKPLLFLFKCYSIAKG